MNFAIIGYGKMGKQIELLLKEKKLNLVSTIDKFNDQAMFKELNQQSLKNVDVAIDFSSGDSVINNIKIYTENKVNAVIGTTGWYDRLEEAKNIVGNNIGLIWSGNFSLGVNIYFRIIKFASFLFNKFSDYDSLVYEIHHKEKKDSPSGTALMIGDSMLKELNNKTKIVTEKLDRKIESNELHIFSGRGGFFPGIHNVMFDSKADTIELKHTARNREGMAYGAVEAAKWIYKKIGFYNIDDMMNDLIK